MAVVVDCGKTPEFRAPPPSFPINSWRTKASADNAEVDTDGEDNIELKADSKCEYWSTEELWVNNECSAWELSAFQAIGVMVSKSSGCGDVIPAFIKYSVSIINGKSKE